MIVPDAFTLAVETLASQWLADRPAPD